MLRRIFLDILKHVSFLFILKKLRKVLEPSGIQEKASRKYASNVSLVSHGAVDNRLRGPVTQSRDQHFLPDNKTD